MTGTVEIKAALRFLPSAFAPATVLLLSAALNPPARADFIPNDQYYNPPTTTWHGPLLNMPAAWDYSLGSPGVTVAIVDTGVITTTPDLAGRVIAPISATGSPPHSDATLLSSATLNHGTWVASVAAMGVNNSIGGSGVGNFSILPVHVTNTAGFPVGSSIALGVKMAADAGARVINVSLSSLTYGGIDANAAYAKEKGALVFVAAGNSGARIERTGLDNLIFVSGTNRNDELWSGSSWGPYVDLSAPADDVLVAAPLTPNGYGTGDGTSFAAPLAVGAAALAWSINPNLTPDQVKSILFTTAVDLGDPGWDERFGHGRINLGAVAEAAYATLVPEPSTLTLACFAAAAASVSVWKTRRRRHYATP